MTEQHPLFAAIYNWIMIPQDWLGFRRQRQEVVSKAKGKVLELGVGTGLNLPLYRNVEHVIGIEPDTHMLKRAYFQSKKALVSVELKLLSAEELPFEDATFDTIVSTLVFCTIPDADKAAKEVHRVLKPEGTFLFLEHVRAKTPRLAKVQDKVTPIWRKLFGGCHPNRDIIAIFQRSGLEISILQNIKYNLVLKGIAKPI
jgi:ubiquinone/menaquinone biosynthesis C-methylase UbiE